MKDYSCAPKDREIWTLRLAGLSGKRIGDLLGIYSSEVRKYCKRHGYVENLPALYELTPAEEPVSNPSGIIVVDVETTGLEDDDEILQVSIIDGDGNMLMNEYVQPYRKTCWHDAQEVNHITPDDVKNSPFAHELFGKLKAILASATTYIGYNSPFDIKMLSAWGADFSGMTVIDVMREFAPIYGEYSEYYGCYKWQKLVTCAKYYGYEFHPHDSLEDVKATLYCYQKMNGENRPEVKADV